MPYTKEINIKKYISKKVFMKDKFSGFQSSLEGMKEKVSHAISEGSGKLASIQEASVEKVNHTISEGSEKLKSMQDSFDHINILSILDKLLEDPLKFKDKILEKLNEIKKNFIEKAEELEKKELQQKMAEQIIASYTELAATSGDILNMTNIIPGAFLATMPAGITLFVKFPAELVMSLATVYGLDITEDSTKDLCLILYISGALQEEKAVITPENIETYLKTVHTHFESPNRKESIKESFNILGKILARKGIVNINNASSEFSINKGFATFLGKQVNNFFQNHYEDMKQLIENPPIALLENTNDKNNKQK